MLPAERLEDEDSDNDEEGEDEGTVEGDPLAGRQSLLHLPRPGFNWVEIY